MTINVHPSLSSSAACQPVDLAYCAGLFDGDGTIGISKQYQAGRKNPTYRLCLALVQNCFKTVCHFQAVVGVHACLIAVKRTTSQNRQVWDLRYDGRHALQVLGLLLPYLVRKSVEAAVAQEFWWACHMGAFPGARGLDAEIWQERERYYKKLRRLK